MINTVDHLIEVEEIDEEGGHEYCMP